MLQSYGNSADSGYAASVIAQSHQTALNERINRWLVGVEQADGTSYTSTPNVKSRRRLSKPYTRAEPHLHRRISSSDTFVEQNLWTPPEVPEISMQEVERGATERRTISPVTFRWLDELPHPHQNPLIATHPGDLEQEYSRIVFMYNKLEDMKQQAELRWLNRQSLSCMQDLMDVGAAIQRVINSAQYIVDFSYSCGFNIDFQNLFSRNRYPLSRRTTLELPQQDPHVRDSVFIHS